MLRFMRRTTVNGRRRATAMVEFAMCAFPFFLLMFSLMEFGRMYMVLQILQAAARVGAREGVTENVTTSDVESAMQSVVTAGGLPLSKVRFYVLDGNVFDEDPFGDPNSMMAELLEANEPYEIADAEPRQLSVVRCEVDFTDVSIMKGILFKYLDNVVLKGQVVVRKE